MNNRRTTASPCPALLRSKALQFSLLFAALLLQIGCGSGNTNTGEQNTPAPAVTGISPSSIPAGGSAVALAVSGRSFVPQSVVQWNSTALPTTFVSSTQLTATVPATLVASAQTASITVVNPDGQSSSGSTTQQVSVANPVPALTAVSPQIILVGSADTTITLTGTNFNSASLAMSGTTTLAATLVSTTQLTAVVPAAALTAKGTLSLSVSNPAPGGGTSQVLPIAVIPPPATLSALSPATATIGSPATTVTIAGSSFLPSDAVYAGSTALPTTYVSAQSLQFSLNAADLSALGTLSISVRDTASSAQPSNVLAFQVVNPSPVLSSLSPSTLPAGSPDTPFTLTGSNFTSTSVVTAGSSTLSTTFVSSTQLSVTVPAADLVSVGSLSLTVSTPAPGGGVSGSIAVSLTQPPATLSAISPGSATLGSAAEAFTLTGNYFTPTSKVYVNYMGVATTYSSATSLQFTVPASSLAYISNLSVDVIDPASRDLQSNVLSLPVIYPVPVLTSISPGVITAGAPNVLLTLTGSNFTPASTVQINAVSYPIWQAGGTTSLTVIIPASALTSVGNLAVTVANPTPGGGSSASQTLQVLSANNRVRTLNNAALALGWDPTHGLILAVTGATSTNNPNSLIAIDPLQGTVVTAQTLPSTPDELAVSDDGSFVYVSLPSTGQVQRFLLPSLAPDITFALGSDANGVPYKAESLSVAPGHPHTVALSRHTNANSIHGAKGGVAVYDDGVQRPNVATPTGYYGAYDALVWGSDATTLYATNDAISTAEEDVFSVDTTGVTLTGSYGGVLGQFSPQLLFDPPTGNLIDGYGDVVNASSGRAVGKINVQNTLAYEANSLALDSAQRKVFFLNVNGFYTSNSPDGTVIQAFNLDQFSALNSLSVDGLSGGIIIRWGTSGLAVGGGSQIFLIDGSFVSPTGISSALGSYAAPSPTLTSISPISVPAGSPDVQLTLTGKDFSLASVVTWNTQTLPLDSVTDTQITVTVPAAMLATAIASELTVSNGPGTLNSNALGFSVLPDLGPGMQLSVLDVSGQDIAWDAQRKLLYLAVPASDPLFGNTVLAVDPVTSTVRNSVIVPDEPSALDLSSDNNFLYVASYGNAVIQRLLPPALSLDLSIPLGASNGSDIPGSTGSCSFGVDVRSAPANPQTIAVTLGSASVEPKGCGGTTIFDNGVARPNSVPYATGGDLTTLAWGADASTLFGQSDPALETQTLQTASVDSQGVTLNRKDASGALGARVHFDPGTNLLYSDSGLITDPTVPRTAGNFGVSGLMVPDSTLGRAFFLTNTPSAPVNGSSYTLDIFDLSSHALLNSFVIPDLLGYPVRIIRWGSDGLAIITQQDSSAAASGMLYILQGAPISGAPAQ